MPVLTITTLDVFSQNEKKVLLDSIAAALVKSGFDKNLRFQKLLVLKPEEFIFDRTFPHLDPVRTDRFVLIEVVLGIGHPKNAKKYLFEQIVKHLTDNLGLAPNDVMTTLTEIDADNISFAAGSQSATTAQLKS